MHRIVDFYHSRFADDDSRNITGILDRPAHELPQTPTVVILHGVSPDIWIYITDHSM